jgi:hypothetical protein
MKIIKLNIVVVLIFLICVFLQFIVHGDTNGPSIPSLPSCSFPPNAKGPCNDPHYFRQTGVGNGYCGRCGDVTYSYVGGSCLGTHPTATYNCVDCIWIKDITYSFVSTPVGHLMYAACLTAYIACLGGDAAFVTYGCGSVCIVSGVPTLGTSCIACIAASGVIGASCTCILGECAENCDYIGTTYTGTSSICNYATCPAPTPKVP